MYMYTLNEIMEAIQEAKKEVEKWEAREAKHNDDILAIITNDIDEGASLRDKISKKRENKVTFEKQLEALNNKANVAHEKAHATRLYIKALNKLFINTAWKAALEKAISNYEKLENVPLRYKRAQKFFDPGVDGIRIYYNEFYNYFDIATSGAYAAIDTTNCEYKYLYDHNGIGEKTAGLDEMKKALDGLQFVEFWQLEEAARNHVRAEKQLEALRDEMRKKADEIKNGGALLGVCFDSKEVRI